MTPEPSQCDIAIVGGGLAGGLIALALRARRPDLRILVVEAGERVGGNHVWSCFESDVAPADRWLIAPLVAYGWSGHDVRFPGQERSFAGAYASLTGERLDAALRDALPPGDLLTGRAAAELTPTRVTLSDGAIIDARAVIDCRGAGDMSALSLGWQKFLGLSWQCEAPHGLSRPVIMDARVDQSEGYRFVYLLPFGAREVFIEDTYYSDTPDLDVERLRHRIATYASVRGWAGQPGERAETGVLPVCMGGDIDALWAANAPGVAKTGVRGGFFHALTGYSLPDAVRVALAVADAADLPGPALHDRLQALARGHWRGQAYYRVLASLLMRAADPPDRWRVLGRFYTLSPGLIGRFYAGRSTLADKLRILLGKPPVPIGRAINVLGATKS